MWLSSKYLGTVVANMFTVKLEQKKYRHAHAHARTKFKIQYVRP
jgi:translation initiation factor IF-1